MENQIVGPAARSTTSEAPPPATEIAAAAPSPAILKDVFGNPVQDDLTDLLRTLRDQINSSDFLEHNPPQGPSIFTLAADADPTSENDDAAEVEPQGQLAGLLRTLHGHLADGGLPSSAMTPEEESALSALTAGACISAPLEEDSALTADDLSDLIAQLDTAVPQRLGGA